MIRALVHQTGENRIVEVKSDDLLVKTVQDGLDLMMSLSYEHQTQKIILHQANLSPDFFVLKTKLAGEILQKATNYGIQLAIVGDFSKVESESLRAFITESNRGRQVFFVESSEAAIKVLTERNL
ncbi:MAG: DUF4180 domain-containing protein [Bdellovibrionales bacterium]|nr:DUF4180 domain-containing protein [Bdellovibrionales bacterium]